MRVAVMVKQVPRAEELQLVDGRLDRDGVALEVNAYCRRANAKAVELAGPRGEVVVFTMGPPSAQDALREMIVCGASRGIHVSDRALAGSDTLVTARVLAAAIFAEGPFDLVLGGLNSVDADTGQVVPQVAELLGLPFIPAAREMELLGDRIHVRSELDNASQTVEAALPAVVSTAERLCDPSKAPPDRRAAVDPDRIRTVSATSLGFRLADVGDAGSPTSVGDPDVVGVERAAILANDCAHAVALLTARGAFASRPSAADVVAPASDGGRHDIWCVLDPIGMHARSGLLGEAATLAERLGSSVTAVVRAAPGRDLGPDGADRVVVVPGEHVDDWADGVAGLIGVERPRIVLVDATTTGRALASAVAARHGWGLTGDGIRVAVDPSGTLTVWKPALGGRMVVPITSVSEVQVATIRPGVLPLREPRASSADLVVYEPVRTHPDRVRVIDVVATDEGRTELSGARVVIAVGQGVDPGEYWRLERLRELLGASIGATRKVTDQGWVPRSRQIGITGLSLDCELVVSIGSSGRYNHTCGFSAARHVLAVNADPAAEIFDSADVGIVGNWRDVLDDLVDAFQRSVSASIIMSPSLDA